MNILEYYVFCSQRGWLQDDERSWSEEQNDFHSAACFRTAEMANDIGKRESSSDQTFYVLACLGSM